MTARWYAIRRAQSLKPATYRCPFCQQQLSAMSEHVLIRPEDRGEGRRHAHTACAMRARKAGKLPTRDEWRATQPREPGPLARLAARLRRT